MSLSSKPLVALPLPALFLELPYSPHTAQIINHQTRSDTLGHHLAVPTRQAVADVSGSLAGSDKLRRCVTSAPGGGRAELDTGCGRRSHRARSDVLWKTVPGAIGVVLQMHLQSGYALQFWASSDLVSEVSTLIGYLAALGYRVLWRVRLASPCS